MIGDKYVPGALVLAQSIRETNSRHALVCMITSDVSDTGRRALALLFDDVVVVPYLAMQSVPRFITAKQRKWYGRWIGRSFTKWHIFNPNVFGAYDKVVLLDADMVFIKNTDCVFDLEPPALTFSTPWAIPYCSNGGIKNYYLHPGELSHGVVVPLDDIARGRVDGFVGRGSMVLARPDAAFFKVIADSVAAGLKPSRCAAGFDEQVLADAFLGQGTTVRHIHQRYNWVVGKERWLDGDPETPYVYQWYGIPKPWLMKKSEWPDLRVWWNVAANVLRFHPELAPFFK